MEISLFCIVMAYLGSFAHFRSWSPELIRMGAWLCQDWLHLTACVKNSDTYLHCQVYGHHTERKIEIGRALSFKIMRGGVTHIG